MIGLQIRLLWKRDGVVVGNGEQQGADLSDIVYGIQIWPISMGIVRLLGEEDPLSLTCMDNLASVYQGRGE